jgi:hypothetical protein
LNDIYNKYKTLKERNNGKLNNFMDEMNPRQNELRKNLIFQENSLKNKDETLKKSDRLSKYLASMTKKNQEEVLMNRTDYFRMKKELNIMIETNKSLDKRYGNYNWIMSLRRPEDFKGTRYTYVNVGHNSNPSWGIIRENCPDNLNNESVVKPFSQSFKEVKNFTKSSFFEKTLPELNNQTNFEKFGEMNVNFKIIL